MDANDWKLLQQNFLLGTISDILVLGLAGNKSVKGGFCA